MEKMTAKEYRAMIARNQTTQKKPRKKSQNNNPANSEHELQKACVQWFKLQYKRFQFLIMAIPNGAYLHGNIRQRSIQWNKLKAEGALKGAADLFLAVPSGELAGLFIEMKTEEGNQSPEQKRFEKYVVNVGYGYVMPRSQKEFIKVVNSYLESGTY